MATHFSGIIPLTHMVTHFSGMIPLTHGYTLLWYDTINTYVTHFSGMIPLTHGYIPEKCVTYVLMVSYQRSV
jgi:hypothetical protein